MLGHRRTPRRLKSIVPPGYTPPFSKCSEDPEDNVNTDNPSDEAMTDVPPEPMLAEEGEMKTTQAETDAARGEPTLLDILTETHATVTKLQHEINELQNMPPYGFFRIEQFLIEKSAARINLRILTENLAIQIGRIEALPHDQPLPPEVQLQLLKTKDEKAQLAVEKVKAEADELRTELDESKVNYQQVIDYLGNTGTENYTLRKNLKTSEAHLKRVTALYEENLG
ncbi:hypothetical protein EJ05DRAFT_523438 [Pseudovirgaria hyperparasitica]|uniref:Uncharacterized protein n=1 Tax=Pseudovirgaria hyperparasitica TaxID=470096 RepID=A0A6A6VR22_9PEZI|nr:uncharacterized protein EJ05DRAFT_523438 [Pseudovirgaria hyperparasitica]KAF2753042.1 hypothetical protein EJ05DRAFT_523438 [Pseudovirgaria hyperparasitica]